MKRIFAAFILVCILFAFCACSPSEDARPEAELSVFELTLSDEVKQQIKVAYDRYCEERYGYTPYYPYDDGPVWTVIEDGVMYESGLRYYGTFNGCVVWFSGGTADAITDFELAGSQFYYPKTCTFFAMYNNDIYEMDEAYELNYLTADDIARIAARHKYFEDNYSDIHFQLNEDGVSVLDFSLPDYVLRKAEKAFVSYGCFDRVEDIRWAKIENGDLISPGIRYYGTFEGSMLFFVEEPGDAQGYDYIGGQRFYHPCPFKFYNYSLYWGIEEINAYTISYEKAKVMLQRHNAYNAVAYPDFIPE